MTLLACHVSMRPEFRFPKLLQQDAPRTPVLVERNGHIPGAHWLASLAKPMDSRSERGCCWRVSEMAPQLEVLAVQTK